MPIYCAYILCLYTLPIYFAYIFCLYTLSHERRSLVKQWTIYFASRVSSTSPTWDTSTLLTDILLHMWPSWHRVVYFGNLSLIYTWRKYLLWGQFTLFILAIGNWWFVSDRSRCFAFHICQFSILQIISKQPVVVYSYIQCDLCCIESAWLFLPRKPKLRDSSYGNNCMLIANVKFRIIQQVFSEGSFSIISGGDFPLKYTSLSHKVIDLVRKRVGDLTRPRAKEYRNSKWSPSPTFPYKKGLISKLAGEQGEEASCKTKICWHLKPAK